MTEFEELKQNFPDTTNFISDWEYDEASFESNIVDVSRYSVKIHSRYTEGSVCTNNSFFLELIYMDDWLRKTTILVGKPKATKEEAIADFKDKLKNFRLFISYLIGDAHVKPEN